MCILLLPILHNQPVYPPPTSGAHVLTGGLVCALICVDFITFYNVFLSIIVHAGFGSLLLGVRSKRVKICPLKTPIYHP